MPSDAKVVTIKIGVREAGAIVVFLLGIAIGVGRLLQRVDTLERASLFEHGGIFTGEKK